MIRKYGVLKRFGEAQQPMAYGSHLLTDKQEIVRGKWMNPHLEVLPSGPYLELAEEIEMKFYVVAAVRVAWGR